MEKIKSNKYFVKACNMYVKACNIYDKCMYYKERVESIKEIPSDIATRLVERAPPIIRDGIFKTFGEEPIPAYGAYYLVTMVLDDEGEEDEDKDDSQPPTNKYKLSPIELEDVINTFEAIEHEKNEDDKSPFPDHVYLFDDTDDPSFVAILFSDVIQARDELLGTIKYTKMKYKDFHEKRKVMQVKVNERLDLIRKFSKRMKVSKIKERLNNN